MNQAKTNHNGCYYCRRRFNDEITRTKDHIVAKANGGLDKEENCVDCCFDCNNWKGSWTLEEWLEVVRRAQKKKKIGVYTEIDIGNMIGSIRKLINRVKRKTGISVYKPH